MKLFRNKEQERIIIEKIDGDKDACKFVEFRIIMTIYFYLFLIITLVENSSLNDNIVYILFKIICIVGLISLIIPEIVILNKIEKTKK